LSLPWTSEKEFMLYMYTHIDCTKDLFTVWNPGPGMRQLQRWDSAGQ
jgi:hypothetical protein